MRSQCGPPKFDKRDWNEFDFTRWNLDGVAGDPGAAMIAGLVEKFFGSEEWRQNFQTTVAELQQHVVDLFKDHSKNLREQRTAAAEDFKQRAMAAQERSDAFRKSIEEAAAPPVVGASPDAYQVGVKVVTEKDDRLGLGDISVQIFDPKNEKAALVEGFTNDDGNAVLVVPPQLAKEFDKRDMTLQVLDPTGKPLARLPNAVCIRVGQTETRVIKVKENEPTRERRREAEARRDDKEGRARHLAGRSELIRKTRDSVFEVLDCRLKDSEAIVAELEKPAPQATEPAREGSEDNGKGSPDSQPRSGSKKRRKKS